MRRAVLAIIASLAAGACDGGSSQFRVHLSWRTEGSLACPAAHCTQMPLGCDAMVSVRVIDARDPDVVYVDQCLPLAAGPDLCGIGALPLLSDRPVPRTAVRVQVAMWPRSEVGDSCPAPVEFDPSGLPQLRGLHPSVGGEHLVIAGDSDEVEIAMGCANIDALAGEACLADQPIRARATVDDFQQRSMVAPATAEYLILSAGAPVERPGKGTDTEWELRPGDLAQLVADRTSRQIPAWTGPLPTDLGDTVCLEVLHRTEGAPTATCRSVPPAARSLDLSGAYVSPALRKIVLDALALDALPADGLVLGRVVDRRGEPVEGIAVAPTPPAKIVYIADDGKHIDEAIATTSASGMFVSIDAGPGTTWSAAASGPAPATPAAVGGRIAGHMTIVELVLGDPPAQE
jgi:hypothetical protein